MTGLDTEAYLRLIRGQARGPAASLARIGLAVAAGPYALGASARNLSFNLGLRKIHRAAVPVISVGNLTLGGTGKTPMVEWIARWYRRRGVRVCLISRGFGQSGTINDEGLVLEENLPDVPHLQDPDRVRLAHIAVDELETQLIVLDDGFQHRRLARDLDLVMLDALDPFGLGRVFPRGLLREPLAGLRRAGAVVLSRADLLDPPERSAIRSEVARRASRLPFLEARHAPIDLVDGEGNAEPIGELGSRKVAAFCGIGNPEGFRRSLQGLCGSLVGFRVFPDHHCYSAADLESLRVWAAGLAPNLVLTTQKDLVKLRTSMLGAVPLLALRIGLEIMDGAEIMEALLEPFLPGNQIPEVAR